MDLRGVWEGVLKMFGVPPSPPAQQEETKELKEARDRLRVLDERLELIQSGHQHPKLHREH